MLVVQGDQDRIVPRSVGEAYASGVPAGRLEIIPGAGHFPQIEASARFVSALGEFLNEREPLKRSA